MRRFSGMVLVVVLLAFCAACQQGDVTPMEVTIGPWLLDCVGLGPQKCLEMDGGFIYEGIDGFHHEEGYTYRLKIERYDAFPGLKEPPQDASRYGYRLVEVLSKTKVSQP